MELEGAVVVIKPLQFGRMDHYHYVLKVMSQNYDSKQCYFLMANYVRKLGRGFHKTYFYYLEPSLN